MLLHRSTHNMDTVLGALMFPDIASQLKMMGTEMQDIELKKRSGNAKIVFTSTKEFALKEMNVSSSILDGIKEKTTRPKLTLKLNCLGS